MYCNKCGEKLNVDAKFCKGCGRSLVEDPNTKYAATRGVRFVNYILDTIIEAVIFVLIFVAIWGLVSLFQNSGVLSSDNFIVTAVNLMLPILVGLSLTGIPNPVYYIFFEGIWQKTPAKWITKTKIVTEQGGKPKFWTVVGRSFARLIPLEQVSFLFGQHPYGWHDKLSSTLVVPNAYTPDEVRLINTENRDEGSRASTVLVWIVAIFIGISVLGILSSVVLASLNSAREKAREASENYQQSAGLTLEMMQEVASDTSSDLPQMLDSETRLDSVEGIENGLIYNYTLINYSRADLQTEGIDLSILKEDIMSSICSSSEMAIYVRNKAKLIYAYYDKNGLFIDDITVNTGIDCIS